jgi:fructose-bisphosphate aldolase class 1
MNLAELNKVAEGHGRARQGHPGRRRIHRHHQEALRRHRRRVDRGQPPRLSRDAVPRDRGDVEHISGVILYDETIWQKAKDGTPLVELIEEGRRDPGIKVDEGTKPLPNCPGELVTEASTALPSGCRNITSRARASPSGAR